MLNNSPEILVVDDFLSTNQLFQCQQEITANKSKREAEKNGKHASYSRYYPDVNTMIPNTINDTLFTDKIHNLIKDFHDGFWKLFNEQLALGFEVQVTAYKKKLKNKYDWHVDHRIENDRYPGIRVLNYILYMSDVADGGELEIADYYGKHDPNRKKYNIIKTIKPKTNRLALMPSWMVHRVKPIKSDDTRITINGHVFLQSIQMINNKFNIVVQ